ncbi:hypothetical protein BJX70DRAFT_78543 [Aspergillus crustosus]
MVYRGRPSRSCRECRRRDIKCDKKETGCSQCSRANITCPLYPNATELLVRNETKHTIKKTAQRYLHPPSSNPLSTHLMPGLEIQAKNFFILQYIDHASPCLFSYMQVFRPPSPDAYPLLATVVNAVFLAFFAATNGSRCGLNSAREVYGSALTITRSTIQQRGKTKLDTTLGAILLLSVFERLTLATEANGVLQNGIGHLRAALELVSLRDQSQFHEQRGLTMFLQLNEALCTTSLAQETEVPSRLLMLRQRAVQQGVDVWSLRWKFSKILLEYTQLTSSIRVGMSAQQSLEWAERLDTDLLGLLHYPQDRGPAPVQSHQGKSAAYSTQSRRNAILLLRILLAQSQHQQRIKCPSGNIDMLLRSDALFHNALLSCVEIWTAIQAWNSEELSIVQAPTVFSYLYVLQQLEMLSVETLELVGEYMNSLKQLKLSASQIIGVEKLENSGPVLSRIWKVWLSISREELFY